MKVLVVGSGARENAFVWRLSKSPSVTKIYAAPGNPGMTPCANFVAIKVTEIEKLVEFAKSEKIDLTIVGPELPLSLGIVDEFRKQGLRIFGPTQKASQLESSKQFAKEVMVAANVPTAAYETFENEEETRTYCNKLGAPLVIKVDGLAAGKGVCVCTESSQIEPALKFVFEDLKASKVIVEEFLDGVEASYIVAANGENAVPMASSHDYKRLLEDQSGPNTGGMGSVSPTSHLNAEQEVWVLDNVIKPTLAEMSKRGIIFSGFLYAGLMISPSGRISVLEFNARMGDPECQSIMRRFKSDFAELMYTLSDPEFSKLPAIEWSNDAAVTVVASASGYPSEVRTGDEIEGLDLISSFLDVVVFHGGTEFTGGKLKTAGGRVLSITATGKTVDEARQKAYRASDMIQFNGKHVRRDIGL